MDNTPQYIAFEQERRHIKTIDATMLFIKQNFKVLIMSILLYAGPFLLIAGFFYGKYIGNIFSVMQTIPQGNGSPDAVIDAYAKIFNLDVAWMLLANMIGMLILFAIVYGYIQQYIKQQQPLSTYAEVWEYAKALLPNIFVTGLLSVLLILLMYLVMVAGIFVINVFALFLIFPFIYVLVHIPFVFIIRIVEQLSFVEALKRSFFLVRDHWWSVFGVSLLANLISSFMGQMLMLPAIGIMYFDMIMSLLGKPTADHSLLYIIFSMIGLLGASMTYAIPMVNATYQYYNLREIKERPSLVQQVDDLHNDPTTL